MDLSLQIEAVYQRALQLRDCATELPVQPDLMAATLKELYFVLEELQASQEELCHQNQELLATRQTVEVERQRYQTLFELAPDGYLVTDRQGKIHQANRAAASLFSVPQEYLISKPLRVLIHESDRDRFQTQLANLEHWENWELLLNIRKGKTKSVAVSVTHLKGQSGHQDALLWSFHDITFRKQMERQLKLAHDELEERVKERTCELSQANVRLQQEINQRKQAEQKIREQATLIDISTDAIFLQDLNQKILFWNKGAERLYGWRAADVMKKQADELFSKESSAQLAAGYQETLERGAWQAELSQVTRTGKSIMVASRWTLVTDDSGAPKSILVVNTDITEKKQLESQFYRIQRMESLGTLASGMAHDLNNIFSPILAIAQLLIQKPDAVQERSQELLQVIVDSAKRGADFVKQILTFAKGSPGQCLSIDISPTLAEIIKIIQQTFPKSIEIHYHQPSTALPLISGDPSQIHQVLMNLCINARDAMPNGGILTLTSEHCTLSKNNIPIHPNAHQGDYVAITITDTGNGISPDLMEHIFEPFFTTKQLSQGTGLGLSIVASLVQRHGGFVEVSSELNHGSQFKVYFPATAEILHQTTDSETLPLGKGELVLIIDDEAAVQYATKIILESHNYRTLTATDSVAAIDLYQQRQKEITATIIDMMMPKIDGFQTLQNLRKINPNAILIAVSGLTTNEQKAISCGASVFLAKPYTVEHLLVTLRDLILGAN
ncbi:PAS domain S-box protein [Alkalinema sp. FACHB-956]|uniref:PAS domain-containing hybrid sensor histidine kinase/response regulator n=1 Tax=Alkalinema sp. FACHB-956 TaxID=2692768 RepID=UPI0016893B28|nr:PAS domain S-box protein [Alkalinema sp. FACHB-956]MBD2328909.1 PAS domain S-box protein [Alkalinema sp. FACHB-956]